MASASLPLREHHPAQQVASFSASRSELYHLFESGTSRGEIATLHGIKTMGVKRVDLRMLLCEGRHRRCARTECNYDKPLSDKLSHYLKITPCGVILNEVTASRMRSSYAVGRTPTFLNTVSAARILGGSSRLVD